MDDTRTRQSLDNLADLYLTGVKPDAEAAKDDPLVGPAPIRLAPKPASVPAPPVSLDVHDHAGANLINDPTPSNESHPILRLTDEDTVGGLAIETEPAQSPVAVISPPEQREERLASTQTKQPTRDAAPPAQAIAEAVILGNLPGLSGPWLTQYAQLIAQGEGPVAIVHVGDDAIDLELVEPRAEAEPAPSVGPASVRIPPMNLAAGSSALVELLDALVRNDTSPVRTVLVRLEASPEAMAVSRLSALDDWTLLSGSDDASIVAAYRMLKQVIEADPRAADKHVGLMMMGCSESEADAAVKRIATTANDYLQTPAQLVGHLRQMQPVTVRQLGSFPDPTAQWPQLVAFLDQLETPEPSEAIEVKAPAQPPAPTPHVNAAPTAPAIATPHQAGPERSAGPGLPDAPRAPTPTLPTMPALPKISAPTISSPLPMPPKPRATAKPRTQARPAAKQQTQPRPKPTPAISRPQTKSPAPRPLTRIRELDLVGLINDGPAAIAGALILDARLPNQPTTQLAVDEEGAVHILVQCMDDQPRQSILDLIAGKQWVIDNLELLALTQRDTVFTDADPVCHLLTDRADLAMGLVNRLGDTLKLHLLQQVTLGKETGWFCTPLN